MQQRKSLEIKMRDNYYYSSRCKAYMKSDIDRKLIIETYCFKCHTTHKFKRITRKRFEEWKNDQM